MRYSGRTERDEEGSWFQVGQLEVTTTVGVLLAWGVMLLVWIVEPVSKPVSSALYLDTGAVRSGELWRIFTWPIAMPGFSLGTIITAAVFWMFGTELERQTYRGPFLRLFLAIVAIYTVFYIGLSTLLGGEEFAAGLSMPTFAIVLLYIAEHPNRPFFFGIPAWVIGAAIVALEVINDLAYRQWVQLLTVILASAAIAVVAKGVGLLTAYDQIPSISLRRRPRTPKPKSKQPAGGGPARGRFGRAKEAEIVEMPQQPARRFNLPKEPEPGADAANADDVLLDSLLDKISASGIDSLTADERRQLDEIRKRRRSTGASRQAGVSARRRGAGRSRQLLGT